MTSTSGADLFESIRLMKSNKHYRVGDVVYHKGYYWDDSAQFIETNCAGTILYYHIKNSPNYYSNNSNKKEILKNLDKSLRFWSEQKGKAEVPSKSSLVIHLRTGDVVELKKFLRKDYKKIIRRFVNQYSDINKVIFVSSMHFGDYKEKNLWLYTQEKYDENRRRLTVLFDDLIRTFPELQFCVRSSEDADEDFYFMVNANYFVMDTGGYSAAINEIRNFRIGSMRRLKELYFRKRYLRGVG